MMRFLDAVLLASTKLRTRKIRTVVTAMLASILFAGLVTAFTLVKGGVTSYMAYSENSLADRYITQVSWLDGMSGADQQSIDLIAQAKARHSQIIVDKKADAKRLGIDYDPNNEPPVVNSPGQGIPDMLNMQNLAARQVLREAAAKRPTSLEKVKNITATYQVKAIYTGKSLGDTTHLKLMKDGKEKFVEESTQNQFAMPEADMLLSQLLYMPQTIVDPFMLAGVDKTPLKTAEGPVPVIVPYSQAESALGLKAMPKSASTAQRLERLKDVKRRAANTMMSVCYRNSASQEALANAKQQILEIEQHKNDKNYQKPARLYALPDPTSCGPVIVTKDSRTAEEKKLADRQHEFDLKYQTAIDPVEKKLTLRIVGLSPDTPDYTSFDTASSLMQAIGGSSLMGRWVVPDTLVDTSVRQSIIPDSEFSDMEAGMYAMSIGDFVEFSSADEAKRFMKEQACSGMDCMSKPIIGYFGSNSVLIDEIMSKATNVLRIAGLVAAAIGGLLMLGMVGRVITDSRRETAVFRAIGARRNDIRLIYAVYIVALSSFIALLAIGGGLAVAAIVSDSLRETLTIQARMMFIESDTTRDFTLFATWPEAIALTFSTVVVVGLFSMLLPLSRNLARSPLRDMRDE